MEGSAEPVDTAPASTTPNIAATLRSVRTMCLRSTNVTFDGRARTRFLVEIVLSLNSVPECLAELANILQSSEESAKEACDYIFTRVADSTGALSWINLRAAQVHGLGCLHYCLLTSSAVHAVFLLAEATLRAMGSLCQSLPLNGTLLDYYVVYEHIGALGQVSFDAVAALLSESNTINHPDTTRHRERLARVLGTCNHCSYGNAVAM